MKCCIIGESGVGKTTLITSYFNQCFKKNETTLGALYTSLNFFDNTDNSIDENTKHKQILQIWDTAGQERYRSLLPLYTRNSDIIILVFNVNNFNSINYLSNFIIKNNASINSNQLRPLYFLVGTHIDLINSDLKYIFDKNCDYNNLDEILKENINSLNYFLVFFAAGFFAAVFLVAGFLATVFLVEASFFAGTSFLALGSALVFFEFSEIF